jgi:hypothetical protein
VASQAALEQGVVKTLRDHFDDPAGKFIGAAPPNLQPPPAFGQWYVGVSEATANPGPATSGDLQDEVFTMVIGVTFKSSVSPYDRLGWMVNKPARNDRQFASPSSVAGDFPQSIKQVASAVATLLRENYTVINNANLFIEGADSAVEAFKEPFHQVVIGPVQDKPASWVHSKADNRTGEISFISITATGARRIRIRGNQDSHS